ncbi:MAG: RNA polymerase sigma factor RpoD/SigA [bacterium]|nr:RNA polymerase sigma factor RpoD/SigA [bacterium]
MKNCEAAGCVSKRIVNFYSKKEESLQNYLKKIASIPVLSYEEEKKLAKRIKEGDLDAKRALVRANLKLAANVAAKIRNSNMTFSDLIQEANIGLLVAVDKYNYKLGYKFSTYATWWIKQAVLKAISEQSGCMKVPVYVQEIVGKYSKMKSKLENELQTSLSIEDMADRMKIEPKKLEEYVNAFQQNLSLDETLSNSDNKEHSLADIIADENATATAKAEYEGLKEAITEAMTVLKEREQKIVVLRFGLNEENKKTLDEIGKMFGITKECVRQTEIRAIKRLKDFCTSRDIDLYCC